MRLKSKLQDWVSADLINGDQLKSIQDFERHKLHQKLQDGIKYAAYLTVLLGIALVVASNWDIFGTYAKLSVHVAINVGLAICIWIWRDNPKKALLREFAVYFLSGLTLTLLALIGQSFQLQGDIGGLLLLWLGLITGFVVIIGQQKRIVSMWCIGFIVTLFYNIEKLGDIEPEYLAFFIMLSMAIILPIAIYMLSKWKRFQNLNIHLAGRLADLSIVASIILAVLSSIMFYEIDASFPKELRLNQIDYYLYLLCFIVIFCISVLIAKFKSRQSDGLNILILSGIFILMPFIVLLQSGILSAVHFIIYAILLSIIAMRGGYETLLTLCLFAISARLFIVFLELFGSMLVTGWGLILAGVMLLCILKITNTIRKRMMREMHAS